MTRRRPLRRPPPDAAFTVLLWALVRHLWRRLDGTRRTIRFLATILALLFSAGAGDELGAHRMGIGPWHPDWPLLATQGAISGGSGTTYYIATTGTDTSNAVCSLASPCASLTHFSSGQGGPALVPGDTVQIQNGTYNLSYSGGQPSSSTLGLWNLAGVAGTSGNPITITGQSQAGVIIQRANPASDFTQQVRLLTLSQGTVNWITLTNMTLVGMQGRGDQGALSDCVTLTTICDVPGTTVTNGAGEVQLLSTIANARITFDHLVIRDTPAGCIKAGAGVSVTYNTLTNCGQFSTMHAFYDGADVAGTTPVLVDHNTVTNSYGQGLYTDDTFQTAPMTMTNNVVQGNGTVGAGFAAAGIQVAAPGSLVQGNIVYDSYCGAIQVGNGAGTIDATHPITVSQNVIANWNVAGTSCAGLNFATPGYETVYNNTFFGQSVSVGIANGTETGPVTYKNNIFAAGSTSGSPHVVLAGGAGSTEDYNMYFNVTFTAGAVIGAKGAHDITADPAFVNALYVASPTATTPLPDVHLTNGSPAVDAGVNVGLPYNSTAPDLGAYESAFSASTGGGAGAGSTTSSGTGAGSGPVHVGQW